MIKHSTDEKSLARMTFLRTFPYFNKYTKCRTLEVTEVKDMLCPAGYGG